MAPGDVRVVRVPGAWEIPLALEELADPASTPPWWPSACVIRGETPHFDYVCAHCMNGIGRVERKHRIPIGCGVLTCENSGQAEERAGGKAGNKGWEAALAALEMADLLRRLRGGAPEA